MAGATEKQKVMDPRVEIDTSPPFESVKEAVDRFGGSGPWIPHHLLRLAAARHAFHHEIGALNSEKIEEQTAQLERDLLKKEQETRNILKQLEAAKNFIQRMKTTLAPRASVLDQHSSEGFSSCPLQSPGLMFMELNQAKLNLTKTSVDLALIQASVESLTQKMHREKLLLEQRSKMQLPASESRNQKADDPEASMAVYQDLNKVNFEAEQFKQMTEASRYEVIKATTEIERTKYSIKMAEMRLNAAKKMEEAAKAIEAIALAQGNVVNDSSDTVSDGITLSVQEYQSLTRKAEDNLCNIKFVDMNVIHQLDVPVLEKFQEVANTQSEGLHHAKITPNLVQQPQNNSSKFKFRNSHPRHRSGAQVHEQRATGAQSGTCSPPITSLGDILSRKFILEDDDVMAGRHTEHRSERQHTSLSQMLREQTRFILHSPKRTPDHLVQRKKFGFINLPLPSKKKTHPLIVR